MPHDLAAEQSVLGGVLLENATMGGVLKLITAADFYGRGNALVFEAMADLFARGEPIDTVMLRNWLVERDRLDRAGGDEHLLSLTNVIPTVANIEQHAALIRKRAIERRLADAFASARGALLGADQDAPSALAKVRTLLETDGAGKPKEKVVDPFDTFRTLREWNVDVDVQPPEPQWLFARVAEDEDGLRSTHGVMECGTVAMLPGMPGLGKSTIKLWCAVAIATGTDWLGWRTATCGRVVFATAEESFPQVHRRLYRLARHLSFTDEERDALYQNLVIWPLRGSSVGLIHGRELGYASTRLCEELLERMAKTPATAIIFDPLSRFASPDVEIDNYAGTSFVAQLERFSLLSSAPTVIFTHHTTKSGADAEDDMFAARGSSSLSGGVKWQANLTSIKGPSANPRWGVKVTVTKSNWAAPAPKVWLRWEQGILRVAENGEVAQLKAALRAEQKNEKASDREEFGAS